MRLAAATFAAAVLLCAPAHAATVSVDGSTLRVSAAPGEQNALSLQPADVLAGDVAYVGDAVPLTAGAGCTPTESPEQATCQTLGVSRVEVDAGDGDDSVQVGLALPATLRGGPGDDQLQGGPLADSISGGDGDDRLTGAEGNDRLLGERGSDVADGGPGADRIQVRDRKLDTAWCGPGRDSVRAEVLDSLDFACERVDYGPAGDVGRLRPVGSRGRFVPVPGQGGPKVDRRILADVLYLIRRYHVRVEAGYAREGHSRSGEHPLGLAVDLVPGPGGSWDAVDRLARWAEPRQNRPRAPLRWVGYNGDPNHGRGNHLHLSWDHTPGRPGRPVRSVWVWQVRL